MPSSRLNPCELEIDLFCNGLRVDVSCTLVEDARKSYDAVIALYHDQGLIPIKTLDFWGATNVTLGLPIVRTSPDHGTGFDIAGKGVADMRSFVAALGMAADIARRRAQ